jgi:outer membrane protein TolC
MEGLKSFYRLLLFLLPLLGPQLLVAQHDLVYFITSAQQNSPLIKDNANLVLANGLEAERLRALYLKPQISATGAYLFAPIISSDNGRTRLNLNSSGAEKYVGYDIASSNGGNYQALLNLTQPLFNEQRFKTIEEQLLIGSQVIRNNAQLTAHDIEKIVTDQYILCLQDYKQVSYVENMVKLLNEQRDLFKKLVEGSIYKQSDLSLLNIEYQNFLAQLAQIKANTRRDFLDLNILCGINDTTYFQVPNVVLTLNTSPERSAYLEKYHLDSLNLSAQQKIFELKYKPQLNWFANTGFNGVYAPNIYRRFGLSAGVNLTYNLFDGHQKNFNRDKILVLQKSISFYRENFISQNTVRKTKILNELQSYTERLAIAEQQMKDYDALLNAYKKEIISGQLTIVNYLNTLKNRAIIQRDYTLLSSQQQLLINAYNYWNW